MMTFFNKHALCILLGLTLIAHTHGELKLCNLELETCGVKPEFNEYTFSSLISDSYDSVLDYFGVNQGNTDNGSYTVDNKVDLFDYFGIQQETEDDYEQAKGHSETGDEFDDSGIDDLFKQAKNIAAMMSKGRNSLDDIERYTGMIHEAMGTIEEKQLNEETGEYQHDKENPDTGKEFSDENVDDFIKQTGTIAAMMSEGRNYLGDINTPADMINEAIYIKEETGDDKHAKGNSDIDKDPFMKQANGIGSFVSGGRRIDSEDINTIADMMREAFDQDEDTSALGEIGDFEYLPMTRLDPGKVGQVRTIDLPDGRKTTIKTLAKRPPIFEIEQFLTDKECDIMLEGGRKAGPVRSAVFMRKTERENGDQKNAVRQSYSTALKPPNIDEEFLDKINKRVSTITNIPMYVLKGSEAISIGHYKPGGFYSAHLDSNEASRKKIPCCFQKSCTDSSGATSDAMDCCTICRYGTFLYYLKDVEGGGETVFPFADMSMSEMLEKRESVPDWQNLTRHCHKASVIVKPAKGKAIFWYNHFLDSKGYLGGVDKRGFHGGCNVTEGSKWIATNWISSPIYSHRFTPSRLGDNILSYKEYLVSQGY